MKPVSIRPAVIAHRQACPSTGIGLSHYVLVTKRPSRTDEQIKSSTK